MKLLFVCGWLGVFVAQGIQSYASGTTLTSGNSSVDVNTWGYIGMNNWVVDGVDQLYKQDFWFRVGDTGSQTSIYDITTSSTLNTPNTLTTVSANSQMSITAQYTLLGGTAGSGSAGIGEQITIQNLGNSPLPLHFFQYTDFDLNGSGAGDTVELNQNMLGLFSEAIQNKAGSHFADVVISPGANHGQAALSPTIFNELTGGPLTLNDDPGPYTGDSTWAFEWDPTLAAGGKFIITIHKSVSTVPEPSSLILAGAGVLALGLRKGWKR